MYIRILIIILIEYTQFNINKNYYFMKNTPYIKIFVIFKTHFYKNTLI